jgi:hypothetical protein
MALKLIHVLFLSLVVMFLLGLQVNSFMYLIFRKVLKQLGLLVLLNRFTIRLTLMGVLFNKGRHQYRQDRPQRLRLHCRQT